MSEEFQDIPEPKAGGSYHKLILHVVKDLFTAEEERLKKSISDLCQMNSQAYGRPMLGFLWEGDFYAPPNTPVNLRAERRSIHESLEDRVRDHVRDATIVAYDRHQIQQVLFKTFSACTTLQQMRNALPNCVTKLIPALKDLERTDEPGCVFPLGSRNREQFDKIAPKLDVYAVGKLFF